MHFDTNPPTLQQLNTRLKSDPRILRSVKSYQYPKLSLICSRRFTTLKIGTTLEQISQSSNPWGLGIGKEQSVKYPTVPTLPSAAEQRKASYMAGY